jgi:hypothetical protein
MVLLLQNTVLELKITSRELQISQVAPEAAMQTLRGWMWSKVWIEHHVHKKNNDKDIFCCRVFIIKKFLLVFPLVSKYVQVAEDLERLNCFEVLYLGSSNWFSCVLSLVMSFIQLVYVLVDGGYRDAS